MNRLKHLFSCPVHCERFWSSAILCYYGTRAIPRLTAIKHAFIMALYRGLSSTQPPSPATTQFISKRHPTPNALEQRQWSLRPRALQRQTYPSPPVRMRLSD